LDGEKFGRKTSDEFRTTSTGYLLGIRFLNFTRSLEVLYFGSLFVAYRGKFLADVFKVRVPKPLSMVPEDIRYR
jgi:hypothetical protein